MKHKFKMTPITQELFAFLEDHSKLPDPILNDVAAFTARLPDAVMQIPKHQGSFMYLVTKMISATRAIEVGCYTGYSAISIAAGLPDHGKLTTFDVDPKTSRMATDFFERAGFAHKIDLITGDARVELSKFIRDRGNAGNHDLAFIDADKVNYETYFELCLEAVKPQGLIIIDNVFRNGEVLAPAPKDLGTQAVRRLVDSLLNDSRVEICTLPMADGLTLVLKR